MCLSKKRHVIWGKNPVKIAKKDIKVYKYLVHYEGETAIVSPHRNFIYEFNKTYETNFCELDLLPVYNYKHKNQWYINQGFHAFLNIEDAIDHRDCHCTIFECVVPNGTKYILSDDIACEIVSERIIILKEIDLESI
jgi:hypothetical protein